ncbi:PaaX family transcriptional regulator [Actinoplanes sp. CA-252034]|uniref:PaaX family transcriptional regulator n=1 Tax=Actinoplanes sp. CA-252034 TaxID=3239906 RepID=UPI003D9895D5
MASPFPIGEIFSDVLTGAARLPRRQAGSSPQGLTVTLIADYTLRNDAWLPATALIALLGEFGVTSAAARMAISRLTRRGVLESRRRGRYSSYRLTRQAAEELLVGGLGIADFAVEEDAWDGFWTFVTFSMPKEETTQRNALRVHLRWNGCAPLYDGVWVSPRPLRSRDLADAAGASSGRLTVVRAQHIALDTDADRSPVEAWDVAAIAEHYETFIRRWSELKPAIAAGRIRGADAVRARTEVMDTYRRFPSIDPMLPTRLMPEGWPRRRAREVFVAVYDGLARPAEQYVRTVAADDEQTHRRIEAHTVEEMLTGLGRVPR